MLCISIKISIINEGVKLYCQNYHQNVLYWELMAL